ncbi:MAG: fused MFS/spermidine synthase [Acidobacteriota bacterium]
MLLTNGKFQGNDAGEMGAQVGFALIPILHQPERHRALVIGLGTGQSAEVVRAAGYEEIEIAEISPGIVAAAREPFAEVNQHVLEAPNVRLFLEDGRNHLLRTTRPYDLITMEINSVWFAGATNLYAREFYELARSRLGPRGIFQQWVQLHHISPREVESTIATLRSAFPHVRVYFVGGQGILVASSAPLSIDAPLQAELETREALARDREALQRWTGSSIGDVASHLLLDERETDRLLATASERGIPINTDGNRFLELSTPRHNLEVAPHALLVIEELLGYVDPGSREQRARAAGLQPANR